MRFLKWDNIKTISFTFVKEFLGQNWFLKVFSLVLAFFFFHFLRESIGHENVFTVPVSVNVAQDGFAVVRTSPSEVKLTMAGSRNELRDFDPSQLGFDLKITDIPDTFSGVVKLHKRDVVGNNGRLRIKRIEPPDIFIKYDEEVEKVFDIATPTLIGQPVQGRAVAELVVSKVKVRGARSSLELLQERNIQMPTQTINVAGKAQEFLERVRILPPVDSGISVVSPPEVGVKVSIVHE